MSNWNLVHIAVSTGFFVMKCFEKVGGALGGAWRFVSDPLSILFGVARGGAYVWEKLCRFVGSIPSYVKSFIEKPQGQTDGENTSNTNRRERQRQRRQRRQ